MASKFIVDTHALLWLLTDDKRLGTNAEKILTDTSSDLILPAIVLAEACWIVEKGRVHFPIDKMIEAIDSDRRYSVFPLTQEIIEKSAGLKIIPEMHDRLIVATALHLIRQDHSIKLITRDKKIRASGLVPILW